MKITIDRVEGGWTSPCAWDEVGESIGTGERFMTVADWYEWCELVRDVADDRGAWIVLGLSTDADLFVLQVAPVKGVSLHSTLQRHNIRECRFFRLARVAA